MKRQCAESESSAGSTSSIRTPPASFGWMKLIREFAVPRRGVVIEQPDSLFAQPLAEGLQVADPVSQLLDAGTALVEELRDRRRVVERSHQLDLRAADRGTAHRQHRLADALIVVDLFVQDDHAEVVVIPRDRRIQVGDRDADVVDCRHQSGAEYSTGVNLIGGHHITVT